MSQGTAPKTPKVDKTVSVTFVSESGLFTYTTKGSRDGTSREQGLDKVAHAIKEKVAESRGLGQDVTALRDEDKRAIVDTLDTLVGAETGHKVEVAGIGTFVRK